MTTTAFVVILTILVALVSPLDSLGDQLMVMRAFVQSTPRATKARASPITGISPSGKPRATVVPTTSRRSPR